MSGRDPRARPLSADTLTHHGAHLRVPAYDRTRLVPGVVHLSVGSFHRAHQAVYFDDLAARGHREWGLVGVALHRPEIQEILDAQDGLYTVVARGADGDDARVIGVLGKLLFAPRDSEAALAALADPRVRVVTLTITAAGYRIDPETGTLAADDPELAADLAQPGQPSSALGFLVEALDRRRRAGSPPFTVLSCDNLPGNGQLARTAVVALARLRAPELADWIAAEGAFPSSMVDRITPQTSPDEREWVAREFGVADRWPVITEPFSQWVIEDAFACGRPPLDEVGAQFVDDVRPYALMKTRLLNAAHCALGHLGALAGYTTSHAAMEDPALAGAIAALLEEVAPLLPPVPGIDLSAYRRSLLERLANPAVGDQLERLRRNGSSKVPEHLLASVAGARATGHAHPALTLAVAAWCRALRGTDERGGQLALDDPRGDRLRRLAEQGGDDPGLLLAERRLFGALGEDEAFAAELAAALATLRRHGARGAAARLSASVDGAIAA